MIRYYCSGFDVNNAFGHGLGKLFKDDLIDTKSIVYIPGGIEKVEKAISKYVPMFTEHFKRVGIEFEKVDVITPDLNNYEAQKLVSNASFIMLMGGNPFKQKEMCEKLGILSSLKEFNGVMLGFSAGAMLMSKFIIITPCSDEYPDFRVEEGLDMDGISIYPHNNTCSELYPDELIAGDEIYKKQDLLIVAKEYGDFYLLQDYLREDGLTDISIIRTVDGNTEFYIENDGKIWKVSKDVVLMNKMIGLKH